MLKDIGWRSHEDHMDLRYRYGEEFQDRSKDIIECIKQYAEKRLKHRLEQMNKYKYLVSQFRNFRESPWFRELPRWARIPIARFSCLNIDSW